MMHLSSKRMQITLHKCLLFVADLYDPDKIIQVYLMILKIVGLGP